MRIDIGNKFECIKSFSITGKAEIFTSGLIYTCEHKGCITNNHGVNTIVCNEKTFNFNEHFKNIKDDSKRL